MTSFINKITGNKYYYIDKNYNLNSIKLNLFYRFLRGSFRLYPETHLKNLIKEVYRFTLNDQFQGTFTDRQIILRLIAKVNAKVLSYICLPDFHLASGEKVYICLRYNISKKQAGADQKISSIDFKVKTVSLDKIHTIFKLTIEKNESGQLRVHLPKSILYGLKCKDTLLINNLLVKIFKDSSKKSPEDPLNIFCYAPDYLFKSEEKLADLEKLNRLNAVQDQAMAELGWDFLKKCRMHEGGKDSKILGMKKIYILKKTFVEKNTILEESGCPSISLRFAAFSDSHCAL